MLECNYLTMLLRPNYEKPVDTADDILDRGLTIISYPGGESILENRLNSPSNITRSLAAVTFVPKVIQFYIETLRKYFAIFNSH